MYKNIIIDLAQWFNQVGINFMRECVLVESEEEARALYSIGKDCWLMESYLNSYIILTELT